MHRLANKKTLIISSCTVQMWKTGIFVLCYMASHLRRQYSLVWVTCFCCSLAQSVRLMMALAIFLSYGLQFYVPMNIMWPFIRPHLRTERAQIFGDYIIRTCLVVFTCKFISHLMFIGPCIVIYFYSKTNQMHNISNSFYFGTTLYMFRTVFPSIVRSLRLYIQHQVYVKQILLTAC